MKNVNKKNQGHGFQIPTITPDNHVFGAQEDRMEVIQDNGDWTAFLPEGEWQARKDYDTYGCTVYNTLKPIAILEKRLFGGSPNFAERFTYIRSGTKPPGNDPHIIAENIRSDGLIDDILLPFDDSITSLDAYASPDPMDDSLVDKGQEWRARRDFKHEWTFTGEHDLKEKIERIKEALRRSPLGVSVVAWKERNGVYIKEEGDQDNHWTCLVAYDNDGFPIVFDSYEPFLKRLDKMYDFGFSKRYFLREIISSPFNLHQTIFTSIKNYLCEIIK